MQRGFWWRLMQRTWLVSLSMVVLLAAYPVNIRLTRVCLLVGICGTWFCVGVRVWRVKLGRILVLTIPIVVLMFWILPGRDVDPAGMRRDYVKALRRYEGTRYIWGGENELGIDCSGLVRRAMICADVGSGLRAFNPKLVREGLYIWWNRCNARELGNGYRGRTRLVLSARSINELDATQLLPGDLAVTSGGAHVLAYLGDAVWIEADPTVGRVITATSPSQNGWLTLPISIVRWRQLES